MTTEIFPDIDSLIIGHVTRDLVSDGRGQVLGGTASYAATVSAVLGRRVGVLTSASADLDLGELTGVAGSVCIPAAHTTTFENRYGRAGREQILHARACEIGPPHVPRSWQHVSLVHIGPVCDECDPELVAFFHGRSFVGLTPQGWMRSVAVGKPVAAKPWLEAERLLPLASAVVLSIEDLHGERELAVHWAQKVPLLVLTDGYNGGVLFVKGQPYVFPALQVPEVDPTGAGDVFAAVFFAAVVDGYDPRLAAHLAACVASHSVTRSGLQGLPGSREVRQCGWGMCV